MSETYLGIIAFSALVMALIQVGVLVAVYQAVSKVERGVARVEEASRPLLAQVDEVSREAKQSLAHVRQQISRGGDAVAQILERVDETVCRVDALVAAPAREGAALVAGARAVVHALRRPFTSGRKDQAATVHPYNRGQQEGGSHVGKVRTSGVSV